MNAKKKPNPFQKKNGKKTPPPAKGKNNQMPMKKPACK